MTNIYISVIIPVFNSQIYIKECLDSVINQSLREIEIILIDDYSTDNTKNILKEYSKLDKRINLFFNTHNIGPALSRNFGISIAKGKFISFMDSDDFYPNKDVLLTLYNAANIHNTNICGGSLVIVNDKSEFINFEVKNQFFKSESFYNYYDYQFEGGFYRFIYKKSFLNMYNVRFKNLRKFEDPIFFINAMQSAKYFYGIPDLTYAYRKNHKDNIWTKKDIKDHLIGIKYLLQLSNKRKFGILHYQMARNLLISLKKRMDSLTVFSKAIVFFSFFRFLNWDYIKKGNEKYKTNISLYTYIKNIIKW